MTSIAVLLAEGPGVDAKYATMNVWIATRNTTRKTTYGVTYNTTRNATLDAIWDVLKEII